MGFFAVCPVPALDFSRALQFDLTTLNWTSLPGPDVALDPAARFGLQLCTINSTVLLFGGYSTGLV